MPGLTDEQKAIMAQLQAEIAATRDSQGLPPVDPATHFAERAATGGPSAAPMPPVPAPAAARQVPAQVPRRPDVPPIPELPERHVDRPGSKAGRIASAIFGGLLSPLTGNFHGARRAREDQAADDRYAHDVRDYQMAMQRRDSAMANRPIPAHLAAEMNIPQGTSWAEIQKLYQPMGYGSLTRQREGHGQDVTLEHFRQKGRSGLEGLRQTGRMDLQKLRNKGKRIGAKKGSGHTDTPGLTRLRAQLGADVFDKGMDDYGVRDTPEARALWNATVNTFGVADADNVLRPIERSHEFQRKQIQDDKESLSKAYTQNYASRSAANNYRTFKKENAAKLPNLVNELSSDPTGTGASSQAARELGDHIRNVVSTFLSARGGSALTDTEASVHAGGVGRLLIGNDNTWLSVDGAQKRLQSYIANQKLSVGEIDRLVNYVSNVSLAADRGVLSRASLDAIRTVPDKNMQAEGYRLHLQRADSNGQLDLPEGARISKQPGTFQVRDGVLHFKYAVPKDGGGWEVKDGTYRE